MGWGAKGGGLQEPSSRILTVSWGGKGRCWKLETAPGGGDTAFGDSLGLTWKRVASLSGELSPLWLGEGGGSLGRGQSGEGSCTFPRTPPRPEIVAQGLASAPGGEV